MTLGRRHPGERELLEHYYGEGASGHVQDHLDRCPPCAGAYLALATDLDCLARLGGDEAGRPEAPEFWEAQATGIHRRLASRRPSGQAAAVTARTGSGVVPAGRWRWAWPAALAAAAAVALLSWVTWSPTTPQVVTTIQEDELDDQLLQEIQAFLEGPLGRRGERDGWPGAEVPTISVL